MPTTQVNDIEIYFEVHGAGKPLVLINGLGYDLWMWHKMIPGLARHFQVLAFDNRGVGKTDKPPGAYTAHMLAEDTAALMKAASIRQAAIMGHSMGGYVAQALALDFPEMVSKLILSATNYGGPNHIPVTAEALAVLTDLEADPVERLRRGIQVSCAPGFSDANPEFLEEWLQYRVQNPILPEPYQSQMAIGMALLAEEASFESKLERVASDTLILFGKHDKVVPPGNAALLQKAIPKSTVKILENAGHFFPFEVPAEAVDAITTFLKT